MIKTSSLLSLMLQLTGVPSSDSTKDLLCSDTIMGYVKAKKSSHWRGVKNRQPEAFTSTMRHQYEMGIAFVATCPT
ncbi:hypothetical protein TNCT_437711 [Trichonephila clavata]|uniref:Secreted protein n=1 Tax=Trichonephila clavata TaxID=2740835 RepID=A0A8X6JBG3_TRICU|nr:hypothetical protein TNCT_437711 [Trichonephila clavata]